MATDWQPPSVLIGRTGGMASRSLYQNLLWSPEPDVFHASSQWRILRRSRESSVELLQPRFDRFAIVVALGKSLVTIAIVRVASDDNWFRMGPTLASFQTFPRQAGLRITMILRLEATCAPISNAPETKIHVYLFIYLFHSVSKKNRISSRVTTIFIVSLALFISRHPVCIERRSSDAQA